MKLNTHSFYGTCLVSLIMFSTTARAGLIVNPANPTSADTVTIEYSTWLSNPGIVVTSTDQTINGYDIILDINTYQQGGIWGPVLVQYDHTFSIGNLPVGIYQVQASYDLQTTSFEVIPEPNSVALLLVGTSVLYLRRRISNHRVDPTR